jgi:zinc/manganese transport system substrate-binding protein
MKRITSSIAVAILAIIPGLASAAGPIGVVAAENFYGDVASQIGGANVTVTSILSNPDEDPHLFEASPSVARAVSGARIIIYNGIDYDPWMEKLLRVSSNSGRDVIVAAALVGGRDGDNPHIWYRPATMPAVAARLEKDLAAADPEHAAEYEARLGRFQQSMEPIKAKIATLHARLAGAPVTATEPVFGYLLEAIGMTVRNRRFQLAVMNNTEPSATDVAAFENDLKQHRVRLLVYNSQASDPAAQHMRTLAIASHIPVVGVTETEPPGTTYQGWVMSELDAVDHALPN